MARLSFCFRRSRDRRRAVPSLFDGRLSFAAKKNARRIFQKKSLSHPSSSFYFFERLFLHFLFVVKDNGDCVGAFFFCISPQSGVLIYFTRFTGSRDLPYRKLLSALCQAQKSNHPYMYSLSRTAHGIWSRVGREAAGFFFAAKRRAPPREAGTTHRPGLPGRESPASGPRRRRKGPGYDVGFSMVLKAGGGVEHRGGRPPHPRGCTRPRKGGGGVRPRVRPHFTPPPAVGGCNPAAAATRRRRRRCHVWRPTDGAPGRSGVCDGRTSAGRRAVAG